MKTATLWAIPLGLVLITVPALAQAKGKDIFAQHCDVCHHAESQEKKMGPGLKGLFKRDKLVNGKKATEANVRAVIDAGGNGMPPYRDMLSEEEKAELIAYLKTL